MAEEFRADLYPPLIPRELDDETQRYLIDLNEAIRDVLSYADSQLMQGDLLTYIRASRGTSDQAIATDVWADVIYNIEAQDVLSEFNTTTGVFTAKNTGIYQINACIGFEALGDGVEHGLQLLKGATVVKAMIQQAAKAANSSVELCITLDLVADDTIKLQAIHWHGSNRNILSATGQTVLTIQKVPGFDDAIVDDNWRFKVVAATLELQKFISGSWETMGIWAE